MAIGELRGAQQREMRAEFERACRDFSTKEAEMLRGLEDARREAKEQTALADGARKDKDAALKTAWEHLMAQEAAFREALLAAARAQPMASRRSAINETLGSEPRPSRISAKICSTFSFRGLSAVAQARWASSATAFVISGRLPRSRLPPQP